MPGTPIYTSLEALLLFQYLTTYGISLAAFTKVAQRLNDDPQIMRDASFDPTRLTPDKLREFFLRVWKDESKNHENVNGTTPSSPRKRKAASPPLPTIQDAANNAALLPKLIIRLYGRYREQIVEEIRQDERKYHELRQELDEIRNGKWDARLQRQNESVKPGQSAGANGASKTHGLVTPASTGLLQPIRDRRERTTARSPSPNSTIIELPKTIPRPLLQPQPAAAQGSIARPLAAHLIASGDHAAAPTQYSTSVVQGPRSPSIPKPAGPMSVVQSQAHQQPHSLLDHNAQQPHAQSHPQHPQSAATQPLLAPRHTAVEQQAGALVSPHPSQRGGIMLPPFQVAPQIPTPIQQQQQQISASSFPPPLQPRISTTTPSSRQQSAVSTPITSKTQHAPSPLVLSISKMLSNPSLASTPLSSPGAAKRLAETRWKDTPDTRISRSPTRPRSRSVSPISETEVFPQTDLKRSSRLKGSTGAPQRAATASLPRSSRSTRKTRGASVASSAIESSVRGRTRSQSVASHVSIEITKVEPSTPNEAMEVDLPPPTSTRRTKRGKRKRSPTATSDIGDASQNVILRPMPVERDSIFAVRNFQRLSNAIMNDIMSHKHASIFSHPVRDRDADGYSSMIRRPSDLKSIKAAIGAGARAVNSANLHSDLLPWSEDLIPPRGIVNSAQLEREVMRMFANAVMFNPGEDDVVRDAREMFASAEESLMNFKSAEQRTESTVTGLRKRAESEASQGAHEDDTPVSTTVGKRRKLG